MVNDAFTRDFRIMAPGPAAAFFAAGFSRHRRDGIRVRASARAPIVSILDKCRSFKFS
jgi:hypothetical protein